MGDKYQHQERVAKEDIPRILLHGTCLYYAGQQCKRHGEYRRDDGERLYLGKTLGETAMLSVERAKFYNDEPILLVIDRDKLDKPVLRDYGQLRIQSLNLGSFETCSSYLEREQPPDRWLTDVEGRVEAAAQAVMRRSREDLEHYNSRRFASF